MSAEAKPTETPAPARVVVLAWDRVLGIVSWIGALVFGFTATPPADGRSALALVLTAAGGFLLGRGAK